MTDVETLVDSHTRAELDQIASEAGVENPEAMANKEEVAQAIVDAEPEAATADEPVEAAKGKPSRSPEEELQKALPDGWFAVNAQEGNYTAEKTVESLGLQKVSEGGATIELLVAACEAYDAHLARVAEGEIPTTSGASPVTPA